ncbi:TPA: hypothetical protein N0F65_003670 [Lagenidium giganteum]|uniref:Uncharacterized protein n=1 Tax=Lagenidium giganteum TaxID=4803 RepID=A0AAV2YGX0_9STRA|nr:TPA: hypothetical protein N0F65_003670 [Lagenidium giganteum]
MKIKASGAPSPAASSDTPVAKFCMFECDHRHLFQSEYKRSNRTKGLKILRCFPHCCPNHIERSYCGSSLSVLVRPATKYTASTNDLFVFARFETSVDAGLAIGEDVGYDTMVSATQTEENPEGQWVPGVRERPSAHSLAMKSANEGSLEHALFFQLNGKVYSRWYYDWESGANKAQRLMKHVLKAYIFQRVDAKGQPFTREDGSEPAGSDAEGSKLRVICCSRSPEFTVISYRRAPSEGVAVAKGDGSIAAQQDSPSGSMDVTVHERGRKLPTSMKRQAERAPMVTVRKPVMPSDLDRKCKRTAGDLPPVARAPAGPQRSTLASGDMTKALEDQILWEHMTSDVVTTSKNLALLYYFVQWTPLEYYASFVDELAHLMHSSVLEVIAGPGNKVEKHNCFSRVLFEHAQSFGVAPRTAFVHSSAQRITLPQELEALLRIVAQALLCLFSNETRQWLSDFFVEHAGAVVNKNAIRESFLVLLTSLEAMLNRQVFGMTPVGTLSNLAEDIIAAVYSYETYHPKRSAVRRILGRHSFMGWQVFVAQMRDMYISLAAKPSPPRGLSSSRAESVWNADWLLDMDGSSWVPSSKDVFQVSLWTMFRLIQQITRLQVVLSVAERKLIIRSASALIPANMGMTWILDGKERIFRMNVDGTSSFLQPGSHGDYKAHIALEGGKQTVLYADVYQWSLAADMDHCYHTELRLECVGNWNQPMLVVEGQVWATSLPQSMSPKEVQYLRETKIKSKIQAVLHSLNSHRVEQGIDRGQSEPIRPWAQLGRFQLRYNRSAQL